MANEDDTIRQRVIIEGADGAAAELNKLGAEGATALEQLRKAGDGDIGKGLRALSPTLAKVQDDFIAAEIAAARMTKGVDGASKSFSGLGKQGSKSTAPIRDDLDQTGKSALGLDLSARNLARTFRALGRVTNIPALAILGRTFRSVAANAQLIAGPAIIGGLGLLANSAAQATQPFQELAFAAGQVPELLQRAAGAALAVGGDVEKFATSLSKIPLAVKETSHQEDALRAASEGVRGAIDKGTVSYFHQLDALKTINQSYETFRLQLALGLDPVSSLREQINDLSDSYKAGGIAKDQFEKQNAKLNAQLTLASRQQRIEQENLDKQVRDANNALIDQDEAAREQVKSAIASKKALEESANAYVKLGISAAQLKTLKPEETVALLAEKLSPMEKGLKRNQIAIEILGENARKFVNALDGGTASMAAFIAQSQRIAPAFTPAEDAIGDRFVTAIGNLEAALGSIKNAFGLAVSPAFTDFFNSLTESFIAIRPIILAFGQALGGFLQPILQGIAIIFRGIVAVIQIVSAAFEATAFVINKFYGSSITGGQLFLTILLALAAAFAPITTLVILAVAAIGLFVDAIKLINFKAIGDTATAAWGEITKGATDLWNLLVGLFNGGAIAISNAFNTSIDFVKGLWEDFKAYLQGWVNVVLDFFKPLIDTIKKISAFFSSGQSDPGAASGPAFAGGGSVRGPGTETSDSILAWLSNNEFVVRARAVAKYGVGFLNAINEGKLDLSDLIGFKMGGLVDAMSPKMGTFNIPAFADGGLNVPGAGLKPVSISFEGTKFNAMMTDTAINQLGKKALRARAVRAGRSPSWVGS
jgi:hypothetical protein